MTLSNEADSVIYDYIVGMNQERFVIDNVDEADATRRLPKLARNKIKRELKKYFQI